MTTTHTTPTRRAVFRGLGLTSIAAGLAVPAVARTKPDDADADAELIRACGEIVASQTRINALCEGRYTIDDEESTDPKLIALCEKQSEPVDFIDRAPPTTLAGVRAVARASIAIAPVKLDGEVEFDGCGAEKLALTADKFVASPLALAAL
jgi:hypothetical protein